MKREHKPTSTATLMKRKIVCEEKFNRTRRNVRTHTRDRVYNKVKCGYYLLHNITVIPSTIKRRSAQVDLLLISSLVSRIINQSISPHFMHIRNMRTSSHQIDSIIITVSTRFPPGVLFLCTHLKMKWCKWVMGTDKCTHAHYTWDNFDTYAQFAHKICSISNMQLDIGGCK